jgi:hypothetical protein
MIAMLTSIYKHPETNPTRVVGNTTCNVCCCNHGRVATNCLQIQI